MENFYENVERMPEGYYRLKAEYRRNLADFYKDEYFQQEHSIYLSKYEKCEKVYFATEAKEKDFAAREINKLVVYNGGGVLDIGYALAEFSRLGYEVTGIDFSIWAASHHNPQIADNVIQGNSYKVMQQFASEGRKFDIITVDNVLEHVDDAILFFKSIIPLCHERTLIFIRVPNDFSIVQRKLFKRGDIDRDFFVTVKTGEHNYYFTRNSLSALGRACGFAEITAYSDFPIDFFLFDKDTNYVMKDGVGHNCYLAKIAIENMLYGNSMQKAFELHKAYADTGVGRDITVVFGLGGYEI